MKRITFILSMLLLSIATTWANTYNNWTEAGQAAQENTDYSISGNTYSIHTAKGLAWVAEMVDDNSDYFYGKTVELTNDIDLTTAGVIDYSGTGNTMGSTVTRGNSWIPIGNNSYAFKGTFDGAGYTISGMYINTDVAQQGLFGNIDVNAVINDLGIINSEIVSIAAQTGAIVGYSNGNITNCYSTADVSGQNICGGLVGQNSEGTVINSYNTGEVESTTTQAGGIVGNNSGAIENCYNMGNVVVDGKGSGIAASNTGDNAVIKNCYYKEYAKTAGNYITGIGSAADIEGQTTVMTESAMKESVFADTLNNWVTLQNSASYKIWNAVANSNPTLGDFLDNVTWTDVAAAAEESTDTETKDYTKVDGDGNVQIHTAKGLVWFMNDVNNGGATYSAVTVTLTADIDLDGMLPSYFATENVMNPNLTAEDSWQAIGTEEKVFAGTFDGAGHTISGVYINSVLAYKGLFGYINSNATIRNLGVINSQIKTSGNAAAILVGYNNGGTVENCYATGEVNGGNKSYIGGLVGSNSGSVTNCYTTATVVGTGNSVGAVAGYSNDGTITNCYFDSSNTTKGVGQTVNSGKGNATGMTADAMKADAFVETLNDGVNALINVSNKLWQKGTDSYPTFSDEYLVVKTWTDVLVNTLSPRDYETDNSGNLKIHTAEGLVWFMDNVNNGNPYSGKTITLTADIDLRAAGVTSYSASTVTAANSWPTIGISDAWDKAFSGTFDGDGHTVSGVYINNPSGENQGLFGYISYNGATIKNLGVTQSNIVGGETVAAIVASNNGTVKNCYSSATVSGNQMVGSLVGINNGSVENCYNIGSVTGTNNVGAVVGYNTTSGETIAASNYYLNTIASGKGIGNEENNNNKTLAMTDADMKAAVDETNALADKLNSWVEQQYTPYMLWKTDATETPSFDRLYYKITWESIGNSATENTDYTKDVDGNVTIHSAAGLAWLAVQVNSGTDDFEGKTVTLDGDISLIRAGVTSYGGTGNTMASTVVAENSWIPIGTETNPFNGTFDGNGHTISGVYINKPNANYQALFGKTYGEAVIKNLRVENADIIGGNFFTAVIVAHSSGDITNNHVSMSQVSGKDNVGGLVGTVSNGEVKNNYTTAKVTATAQHGAVAGYVTTTGTVTNCYYLEGSATQGIGKDNSSTSTTESKTDAEMKADAFVTTLNNWVNSQYESYFLWQAASGGYPIFDTLHNPVTWESVATNASSTDDYTVSGNNVTIKTAAGLAWFANQVNSGADYFGGKTVTLENNIDLRDANVMDYGGTGNVMLGTVTASNSWTAIGIDANNAFEGTFDGSGHTVSGVYINRTQYSTGFYQGLFGYVNGINKTNATIKNLGVIDSQIIGYNSVGALIGENYEASVINCYSTAYVGGYSNNIGGVVGHNSNSTVRNSYSTGEVEYLGTNNIQAIGAVVGHNNNGTVTNSYYLDSSASNGIGEGNGETTSMTEAQMTAATGEPNALLDKLNSWVTAQTDFYAQWENGADNYPTFAKAYTLTLDADGGTVSPAAINVYTGFAIVKLPTPTREGYTFEGWKIGDAAITETTVWDYTSDQTAVAQWKEDSNTDDGDETAAEIERMKTEKLADIDNLFNNYNEADYRPEQWEDLTDIFTEAKKEVSEATTVEKIGKVDINKLKADADAILTDAEMIATEQDTFNKAKVALQASIEAAEDKQAEEGYETKYTNETRKSVADALSNAKKTLEEYGNSTDIAAATSEMHSAIHSLDTAIERLEENPTVGIDSVESSELFTRDGNTILFAKPTQIAVYNISGQIIYIGKTEEYTLPQAEGIYILRTANGSWKLAKQ